MSELKSGDIIQNLMDTLSIDRKELEQKVNINYQTLSKLINNDRPLTLPHATKLSEFFTRELGRKITIEYLMGRETDAPTHEQEIQQEEMILVPILGAVRAGLPILATENVVGYEKMSAESVRNGEYFYLNVTGDSMVDAKIFPGGRVLVRKQDWVDNNQIAVVLVNNEDATVKRVKWVHDKIILYAANSSYEPQIYDIRDVRILGRVVKAEISF